MWVEQSNNKFNYREYYTDPLTDKKKTVSIVHEKNAKPGSKLWNELAFLLQQKIEKKLQAHPLIHNDLTVRELVESWLEYYKGSVKQSTDSRRVTHLKPIIRALGDIQVIKIQAHHFNTLYNDLLTTKSHSYHTIKQMDSVVKRVMKHAYKYFGINKNELIELLEVPKKNILPSNDYKFLERNELQLIIDFFEENQSMIISKTYNFDTNEFTTTKTNKARTIYFNLEVANAIKKQIGFSQLRTIKHNLDHENTLLFKSIHDRPIHITYFNDHLKKVPNIDKHLTSHIFRHTFISIALEKGISKDLIQQQVGHADSKMIDTIYGHVTAGRIEQQKKAMLDFKII